MKIYIILLIFLLTTNVNAQEILGVSFGQNYNTVKSILRKKYGGKVTDDIDEGYNKYISIEDITFGGIKFDKVGFSFKYADKTSKFDFVMFQARYGNNSYDCADTDMDKLLEFVERKYGELYPSKNDDYIRYVEFGEMPKYKYLHIGAVGIKKTTGLNGMTNYHLVFLSGTIE